MAHSKNSDGFAYDEYLVNIYPDSVYVTAKLANYFVTFNQYHIEKALNCLKTCSVS